ncbi:hypothetical protein OAA60_03415 [Porticoccaceae bacterium]|nr:hypothetical protein [Porticoccaceae bacterium]
MIKLILMTMILSTQLAQASDYDVENFLSKTHITIGAAYKLNENIRNYNGEPYKSSPTARLEVYYQYDKFIRFGVSHHSQWLKGKPFNDDWEYQKTELFIDYTFSLDDIF